MLHTGMRAPPALSYHIRLSPGGEDAYAEQFAKIEVLATNPFNFEFFARTNSTADRQRIPSNQSTSVKFLGLAYAIDDWVAWVEFGEADRRIVETMFSHLRKANCRRNSMTL